MPSSPARSAGTGSRSPLAAGRPLRLLLLEDDPTFQLLVRIELEDQTSPAMDLVVAERLEEGIALIDASPCDAILTDLNLPDSHGFETFERLMAAAPDVPLVVMTNLLDEAVAAQILRRGAQDYLQKARLPTGALGRIIRRAIERHSYARQLAESEARVRAIYEASIDAIVVTDGDGIVRFANPAAGGMFGRKPAALIGGAFGFPVAAGEVTEIDIVRPDGSVGIAEMHVVELPWDGAPAYLASLRDITNRKRAEVERREMETRLRQAHKLEAIGQLAAGIAHEINTPAHFVGHNLQFVRESFQSLTSLVNRRGGAGELPADAAEVGRLLREIPPALEDAAEGIERVGRIVQAMKEFSHPGGDAQAEPADLNHLVGSAIVVAQHEWKLVADVVTDFDPDLPPVPVYAGEFNQVLLNLLVNAAHAIADGPLARGTITVSTRRRGATVELRVADTGRGIPADIRHRIFEPFFTTKRVGEGTGQGLAHAHAIIVGRHGGEISFNSEIGRGTCFIIRLPLA